MKDEPKKPKTQGVGNTGVAVRDKTAVVSVDYASVFIDEPKQAEMVGKWLLEWAAWRRAGR